MFMSASPATSQATRFATVYVDPAKLNRTPGPADKSPGPAQGLRLIGVTEQVTHVRKNVRDAARAVLTWVASVMDQQDGELDCVLDACLRPGPDSERVNYAALAERVNAFSGLDLSAKRVCTAILNLRRVHSEAVTRDHAVVATDGLAQLRQRLAANIDSLIVGQDNVRRAMASELLAAVRTCGGRLIAAPYGEGVAHAMDPASLEGRLIRFVRDAVHDEPAHLRPDLHRLLNVLEHADGSAESDTAVVVTGARVVCDLMGADSLPGLLAQLNVVVVGRQILGSELYIAELHRLAEASAELHDDADTRRYLNWARRLPEDRRVPTALRVASFARNNLATHLLERIITGELADAADSLSQAQTAIDAMRHVDGRFRLLPVTEAIYATALAVAGVDEQHVIELFRTMGLDAAATLLADLSQFDSNRQVVEAVRQRAIAALPELRYRFIAV